MSSWSHRQLTGAACVLCAVFVVVTGRTLMLDKVQGQRALCPLVVKMDTDPARIPRVIKTVGCAERDSKQNRACCGRDSWQHQCVEVQDRVMVQYNDGPDSVRTEELTVSVGCVCIRMEAGEAALPPSPTR